MKLNNKGWGLTDYLLMVSVIIIALLVASVLIIRLTNGLKENIKVNENNDTKIEENNEKQDNLSTSEVIDSNPINYVSLEDSMISAAIKYIEITYKNNIGEELLIVDYPHILEVDSNIKDKMSKDNCNGYVEVRKNNENIEYTSFIKCDNYSTDGVKDYYIN